MTNAMKNYSRDRALFRLREEFGSIETINPEQPTYGKLCEFLDSCSNDYLKFLRDADIKWVSSLARNRCIRRGIL